MIGIELLLKILKRYLLIQKTHVEFLSSIKYDKQTFLDALIENHIFYFIT